MDNFVDYARPMIDIEVAMRQIHDACLSKDWERAEELVIQARQRMIDLRAAIVLMSKNDL